MLGLSQPDALLLGSCNPGKVNEIKSILGDIGPTLRSLKEFENVGTPQETADAYSGNAVIKAQFYSAATGLWALADDSGLEVEALGGAPGVFSARYEGENASDAERRVLLLSELAKVNKEKRKARFVCAVAVVTPTGAVANLAEGICEGKIAFAPRGTHGFGYDPLFIPDGYAETFAELACSIKNLISHRGRALEKTRNFLRYLAKPA